ncbi:MAG: undecaprenyl-phosphate glucose phosphotransferase [Proteobacteria bacterium]|nr:undecaprenyl-phosphate glucose phosphotransferase [Pseudomonadota bacterium]
MLYRYSEIFRSTILGVDLLLVSGSWVAAYYIRFATAWPTPLGIPELGEYLVPLPVIAGLWWVLYRRRGLYAPRRTGSLLSEAVDIARANVAGVLLLTAATFFARSYFYSRGVIAVFFVLSTLSVVSLRVVVRASLRELRRRGYNQRHVLVVGGARLSGEIVDRIHAHPEAGLRVKGVLSEEAVREIRGVPVLSGYGGLKGALGGVTRVDQVILALRRDEWQHLEKLLNELDDEFVSVKLAPDLLDVMTLRSSIEDMDGLPLIGLRDSPLVGWAGVQKRIFDVAVSGLALVVLSPLMAVIALAIRATAGAPVLYRQERMGLDGQVFQTLKFRTMAPDAESTSGPVWTVPDDPRRTRLGALLRRFNLDELPQLVNVLRGEMSLVGPRPERPVFIEQFRREIPGYMLRHKVKAGLTGWAQVHGWRGNTSLHERLEHDIYYIQNWSLALDVQILLLTLWRGFDDDHAY